MAYDLARDYISVPDGRGGVTASFRRPIRVRTHDGCTVPYRTRDIDDPGAVRLSTEERPNREPPRTARTAAEARHLITTLTLRPGERVELEERDAVVGANTLVDVIVISPTDPDLAGNTPSGASGMTDRARLRAANDAAARFWAGGGTTPPATGTSRSEAAQIRAQNDANRKFWNV